MDYVISMYATILGIARTSTLQANANISIFYYLFHYVLQNIAETFQTV